MDDYLESLVNLNRFHSNQCTLEMVEPIRQLIDKWFEMDLAIQSPFDMKMLHGRQLRATESTHVEQSGSMMPELGCHRTQHLKQQNS